MTSNVMNANQFKGGIVRQTMTMELADRLERGEQDVEFRGDFSVYLRTIGSKLQHGFGESTRRGGRGNI